jgi:DNA polymerase III sliding clamp (beta) subunit (PCNA family)
MRFDKHKDPGALAAKAGTRYAINGVAIVQRDGGTYIAATDGRALTLVRAYTDEGDAPHGIYPVAAFTAARKAARRRADATLAINGSARIEADGAATDYAKVDGTFPDLAGVVPTSKPERVLRLDAEYLARIQRALGADGVEIRMHDDDRDRMPLTIVPIYTTGGVNDGSFGVLMPIGGGQ